jgi:transposase
MKNKTEKKSSKMKEGKSPQELASEMGFSIWKVYRILKEYREKEGMEWKRGQRLDERTERMVREMIEERRRWSVKQVAERNGCRADSVRNFLRRIGERFISDDKERNEAIEKQLKEHVRKRGKERGPSPHDISRKWHCDHKKVYEWLKAEGIMKEGQRHGVDYFIKEEDEGRFREWLKGRKSMSANGVAKRSGCSRQAAAEWAEKHGVQKKGSRYMFSEAEEDAFKRRGRKAGERNNPLID